MDEVVVLIVPFPAKDFLLATIIVHHFIPATSTKCSMKLKRGLRHIYLYTHYATAKKIQEQRSICMCEVEMYGIYY